jgi:hypothetical protein
MLCTVAALRSPSPDASRPAGSPPSERSIREPVSADDSRVTVLALATNEELIVARRAYRCLEAQSLSRRGA